MARTRRMVGLALLAGVTLALSGLMAACGGEDRPDGSVSVSGGGTISGTGTGTVSGTGTGTVSGTGTGTATGVAAEPGVVEPAPEGATEVTVALDEWSVSPERAEVSAGAVYFLADNAGEEPHELVVIRTDEDPGALPVEDGKVPEDRVEVIGEIEAFAAGSQASGVFDLEPGSYALICNIVEQEDGETESHYENGMYVDFTVTE